MTATLRHRGPDDEGYYVDGQVALGHRRLQIIDLTTGHQPIANETGTVHAILHGEIRRDLDLRSVARYLGNGYVPDPHTILAGVQKLPPGHFLHLTAGKVRVGRYWDLPFAVGEPRPTSDAGWSHALWDSLCTSVKNRLVSD